MNAYALTSAARDLAQGGPLGVIVAGMPGVALAALALLPYASPKRGGARPAPLVAWCALFAACAVAAAVLVARERSMFVHAILGDGDVDRVEKFFAISRHAALSFDAQLFCGLAILIALPPAGFVLARRAASAAREGAGRTIWLVAVAAIAMLWATALSVVRATSALWFSGCGMSPAARHEELLAAFAPLEDSRAIVLGVATFVTATLVTAGMLRDRPLRLAGAAGPSLIVAGIVAWAGARALAHDAAHPLPFLDGTPSPTSIALPPATRCAEPPEGPLLAREAGGWVVDGAPVRGPGELAEILRAKRWLWGQLHPSRTPPSALLVAVALPAPAEEIAPLLASARAEGFADVAYLFERPRSWVESETAGRIERTPRVCASPAALR